MTEQNPPAEEKYADVTLAEWERAFDPIVVDFSATRFVFSAEDQGQVRIAFGNKGPFTSKEGHRNAPQYTHAVTIPPLLAVELAQQLLKHYARVGDGL